MDTAFKWVALAGLAGGAYLYYQRQERPGGKMSRNQKAEIKSRRDNQRRRESAAESHGSDVVENTGGAKKRKSVKFNDAPKEAADTKSKTDPKPSITETSDKDEEGLDNRAFAEQLAGKRKGTSLAPPESKQKASKTRKQSKMRGHVSADQVADAADLSAASSTGGADADDDLSPAVSPALQAEPEAPLAQSGGVEDMLEPASSGPSVLRLTEPLQAPRQPRASKPKESETAETKKQRQNRKKVEEKRLVREAEERERRVLMEKQRRTAREAEGRPAKNGLGPAQVPQQSAWKVSQNVNGSSSASADIASNAPLLDTFDVSESKVTNGGPVKTTSAKTWERNLPSEEEQMRLIAENEEASWSTVSKKSKKKKSSTALNGSTDGSETQDQPASGSSYGILASARDDE